MGSTCSSSFKSDWLLLLDGYVLIGSGKQKTKQNRLSITDSGLKFKMAFKQRYCRKVQNTQRLHEHCIMLNNNLFFQGFQSSRLSLQHGRQTSNILSDCVLVVSLLSYLSLHHIDLCSCKNQVSNFFCGLLTEKSLVKVLFINRYSRWIRNPFIVLEGVLLKFVFPVA